jgi:hypothetical protein
MTKLDQLFVDPEWATHKNLRITKYNRTTTVIVGTINFMKDLPNNALVSMIHSLLFPRMMFFIPV